LTNTTVCPLLMVHGWQQPCLFESSALVCAEVRVEVARRRALDSVSKLFGVACITLLRPREIVGEVANRPIVQAQSKRSLADLGCGRAAVVGAGLASVLWT
jgi:hypothetical protein